VTATTDPTSTPSAPTPEQSAGEEGPPPTRRRASRWWRYGFPVALVALILAIPALMWAGAQVVLGSSEGREIRVVTDPAAPGWEATVDPTPVLALAVLDPQGELDHVAVLALTAEGTGGAVVFPSGTVMGVQGIGNIPLNVVYQTQGVEVVKEGLQGILGIGVPDIRTIQAAEWAELVGPVAPLTVDNVDAVVAASGPDEGATLYPRGEVELAASEVASFLVTDGAGQNDLSRMVRVAAFWDAWVAAVAESPDAEGIVPGEVDSGLGRFVRTLARGQVSVTDLPVIILPMPDGSGEVYEPRPDEVPLLMSQLVPFPAGPEGKRARLRVLDGTGQLDHGLGAATLLAANGGQINKVGNAPEFGVATTTLTYYDEALRSRAEVLREALGVGELIKSDEINVAVDITIVLGEDYAASPQDAGLGSLTPNVTTSAAGDDG
jgi:hypothetical protein